MFSVHEDTRPLVTGGPLRCVLALLPDLTDEQLNWLMSERGIPHLLAKLATCEPRVEHPDDPGPGAREWTLELETEASLQDRGPARAPAVLDGIEFDAAAREIVKPLAGVSVVDCDEDDDDEDDPDRTALEPVTIFHGPPRGH